MILYIHTDGGARGNPGPSAVGVVVQDENAKVLHKFGKRIGETTNNVAEYTAVTEALQYIKSQFSVSNEKEQIERIKFFLDSNLVVNQLNGLFKIKNSELRNLLFKIRELESEIGGNISYTHIPREQNQLADQLVNQALDSI